MQGQIREHPLAELIREAMAAGLSGALRLSRERARVAIYFEDGRLVFAASNLRAHRLREILKRSGFSDQQLAGLSLRVPDQELADVLLQSGRVSPSALATIRSNQVSDVLRLALLWIDGTWEFDSRVRLADEVRVPIDISRLLVECARHLPSGFVKSRLNRTNGSYSNSANFDEAVTLLPAEATVLSYTDTPTTLAELAALIRGPEDETLRAVYALSLSGLLQRSDWPQVFAAETFDVTQGRARSTRRVPVAPQIAPEAAATGVDDVADAQALFARLKNAKDHYEVLDVARLATIEEIKNAYHGLALRFHPDRFHQSDPQFRNQVESAFARIAQAYETLNDQSRRKDYDALSTPRTTVRKAAAPAKDSKGAKKSSAVPEAERAEQSFRRGMDALQRNHPDEAVRFLAEAAMLAPREARYRAHYGHALIRQSNTRRIAETELQAALTLEPDNTEFRVMLAELYQQLGMRRRAEGELARALAADPRNEAARLLLSELKSK